MKFLKSWAIRIGLGTALAVGGTAAYVGFFYDNMGKIGNEIVRTRQLDGNDLEQLIDDENICSILNLRGEHKGEDWYDDEIEAATSRGVEVYSIRMSTRKFPEKEKLLKLLKIFDEAKYPMNIHCRAGADRTGFACAVYRLHKRNESYEDAIESLTIRHGHVLRMPLDFVLERYNIEANGKPFEEWVSKDYSVNRLKEMWDEE